MPIFLIGQKTDFANEWKKDKALKGASLAYCVMDAKTASIISEYNAIEQVIPASTLKIVSTSAALQILGADFRYATKLFYTGSLSANGTLNGDLIILGSGDPTLQSEKFGAGSVTDFWAQKIKEKGIKEIQGKIIGNAACFDHVVPDDWIWADISNYFGAVPCGLSYRDNKFKLYFNSGAAGTKTSLEKIWPDYLDKKFKIENEVLAGGNEDEAYVYGNPFGFSKIVKGTLPANKTNYEVEAALPDPALLCAQDLYLSLNKIGITCDKNKVLSDYEGKDTANVHLIYTQYSPSLDKIIFHTNLSSNNLYCESLVKTLGKGNSAKGIERIKKHFSERGLYTDQLYMVDASGLSRANTITVAFQTQLLSKIYRDSSTYQIINASLPVSGKSGSMSNMGKGSAIENNLRAKTGYIKRCRAYCGYVKSKSGNDLAFSIIFNNYNCSAREAKLKIEKWMIEMENL